MKPTKTLATKCYKTDFRGLELIAASEDHLTQQYIYNRYNNIQDSFKSNTSWEHDTVPMGILWELFKEVAPKAYDLYMNQVDEDIQNYLDKVKKRLYKTAR